jgi:site-specific DNA-methyltransferase (adenine-specific)
MTTLVNTRRWEVRHADCLTALQRLDADSIDAVITDPPYGINIASWDRPTRLNQAHTQRRRAQVSASIAYQQFTEKWARDCLRVLKPGGHLAAFSSTRNFHLLASGVESAGFEIRDLLLWLHGQGFPASRPLPGGLATALRPAVEPILLARKPLDRTLTRNIAHHGTGALNIDRCRTGRSRPSRRPGSASHLGRWPTNVVLSHSERCTPARCERNCPVTVLGERHRLFFCAKPSRRQREAGCERLPRRTTQTFKLSADELHHAESNPVANIHPTVKPLDLMRWIARLLTPPMQGAGAIVLDPFAGSGSTGAAAVMEGARFLGIERDPAYVPIARARIKHWARSTEQSRKQATKRNQGRPSCAARASTPPAARRRSRLSADPATVSPSKQRGRGRCNAARPDTGDNASHARTTYRKQNPRSTGPASPRAARRA